MPSHKLFLPLSILLQVACVETDKDASDTGDDTMDADGDGFVASEDCDDSNSAIYPGADEICGDAIDNDCDDAIDEEDAIDAVTAYADSDGDGFGDSDSAVTSCEVPSGHVSDSTDCNDNDADQYPGADEYCNEEDDDCDGAIDEEDAVDPSVWYADADADGYGDAENTTETCRAPTGYTDTSNDCDDTAAHIHPNADEMCDGEDTDCDPTTGEEGLVSLEDTDGTLWNVWADFSGTASEPATPTLDAEGGTYWFCDGTHYINGTVTTSVNLESRSGDAESTELSGGGSGTVLTVSGDDIELSIDSLTIMNGSGTQELIFAEGSLGLAGGGIYCAGDSEIELDEVWMLSNSGYASGGAIASDGCHIEIDDSHFEDNEASYGSSIFVINGDVSVRDSDILSNGESLTGNGGLFAGAIYQMAVSDSIEFDMVESHFSGHQSSCGTVVLQNYFDGEIEGRCSGSTGSTSGFTANDGGECGALALVGDDLSFESSSCDWGDFSSSDDNVPADISYWTMNDDGISHTYFYSLGDDQDFECEAGRCGTQSSHTLGASSGNSDTVGGARGNLVQSEGTATIDSFSVLVYPKESCTFDLYVLAQDGSTGSWTSIFTVSESLSSGLQWVDSGPIGLALEDGTTYGLVYGWDCDLEYYYDATVGSSSLDGGFGTSAGRWNDTDYSSYGTNPDDLSHAASNTRYYMKIDISE